MGPGSREKGAFLRAGGVIGERRGVFRPDSDIMSGCAPPENYPRGLVGRVRIPRLGVTALEESLDRSLRQLQSCCSLHSDGYNLKRFDRELEAEPRDG